MSVGWLFDTPSSELITHTHMLVPCPLFINERSNTATSRSDGAERPSHPMRQRNISAIMLRPRWRSSRGELYAAARH